MADSGIQTGMSGIAVVRAADAMLRSLGGGEIQLLLPAMGMPDDPSAELGLVDPGVEQITLSPVVARNLPTSGVGPRQRVEFLIPAAAVSAELTSRNVASAQILLDSSLGVIRDGELFHIEGFTTEYFAGTPYLHRVVAVD